MLPNFVYQKVTVSRWRNRSGPDLGQVPFSEQKMLPNFVYQKVTVLRWRNRFRTRFEPILCSGPEKQTISRLLDSSGTIWSLLEPSGASDSHRLPEGGWGLPHTFAKICILTQNAKKIAGSHKPFCLNSNTPPTCIISRDPLWIERSEFLGV